ncbi:alpha-1,4-glucan--maltose-1-phosphate maltosyltransferase [Nocardioides marmoriginsengisoli]|uniref:Alpha-1,4-glucan:maltose-1-phosphate maltosyltransferase n=1 Tax=Nocardioides marmoriginsengisoli TaxID=661483 RepID=A0A3N0CID8_9ACTN|nr:alpha-1,4-glucan--maltose-1-phosphate maltosyltransferase [Nocardioides marmoriginsengisoli]RNL63212.1 alpha-1,4-glucan--maltose-1-phosphate maltosyltransferase [Nocardioides marmoriginsengisoli]
MVGRIPVMDVTPVVERGRYPAKSIVGESFAVTAVVFREGHDQLGADVVLTDPAGVRRDPVRMLPVPVGVDRRAATVAADTLGAWTFTIESWSDPLATWSHDAGIKIRAGVDVELMFTEGAELLERWGRETQAPKDARAIILDTITALRDSARPVEVRLAAAEDPAVLELMAAYPLRELLSVDGPYPLQVERERALVGSWYEFFPRSEGAVAHADGSITPGTLRTAAKRLDAVAAMGFDVVYLPPIHPIGEVNRKGRNNSLTPTATDVGSPWAIGAKAGGHDKVHPDLGTLKDFDAFVKRATALGLEVALDLALQAAPDHPWVQAHPEWFTTRADGTIAYAENPPKKYQDIYPVNFDNDPEGIYAEVLRIVRHWMKHGVRIFRVDNPHTKPLAFWERLLGELRATDPDVLFLAEAFTKPPMMHALAKIGFHQSYTYFTWRNTRREVESYLRELAEESAAFFRPNFFVNTPDILHEFLQHGGPAAFRIRAVLAATGSPSWGVYAGFELCERMAVRPGSEEYLDSEKYEVKVRDWEGAEAEGRSLAPYLTRLNELRRQHPALRQLRDLVVHDSGNENIVCFSKRARPGVSTGSTSGGARPGVSTGSTSGAGTDLVIVVLNLDPHSAHETMVRLDLAALGLPGDAVLEVHDELSGQTWSWGADNYVRLDPSVEVAHILSVRLNQ